MSLLVTPTTELQAVNDMLTAIGTVPVNSLDVSGLTDAAIAKDVLAFTSREVQSKGWWFNTNKNVTMTPSAGTITVGSNMMRVTPSLGTALNPAGSSTNFTVREGKLWNTATNSFTFSSAVKADVVYLFDFEELPESARRAIALRAARVFQNKMLGDATLGTYTAEQELEAYQIMEGDHTSDPNTSIYMERVRSRFNQLRPDPVVFGAPQQSQRTR